MFVGRGGNRSKGLGTWGSDERLEKPYETETKTNSFTKKSRKKASHQKDRVRPFNISTGRKATGESQIKKESTMLQENEQTKKNDRT